MKSVGRLIVTHNWRRQHKEEVMYLDRLGLTDPYSGSSEPANENAACGD